MWPPPGVTRKGGCPGKVFPTVEHPPEAGREPGSRAIKKKKEFPRMGILPEGFDGGAPSGAIGGSPGCRAMGKNNISHGCSTPGSLINRRDRATGFRACLPKEEGRGNPLEG